MAPQKCELSSQVTVGRNQRHGQVTKARASPRIVNNRQDHQPKFHQQQAKITVAIDFSKHASEGKTGGRKRGEEYFKKFVGEGGGSRPF